MDIHLVVLNEKVIKNLKKLPSHISNKLKFWIDEIEIKGLSKVRKISGYHDEPLKGKREGQRSIRLNKAYRAIYEIRDDAIEFVEVVEVNKHEY